jgi:hypothetical protein
MNKRRHSNTTTSQEAAKTTALINDLVHVVQIDDAIKAEEELAGVFDPAQAKYPMHARKLAERRNNLIDTIAALSSREKTAPHEK